MQDAARGSAAAGKRTSVEGPNVSGKNRSRRRWSDEEKTRVVRESLRPGKRVGEVARADRRSLRSPRPATFRDGARVRGPRRATGRDRHGHCPPSSTGLPAVRRAGRSGTRPRRAVRAPPRARARSPESSTGIRAPLRRYRVDRALARTPALRSAGRCARGTSGRRGRSRARALRRGFRAHAQKAVRGARARSSCARPVSSRSPRPCRIRSRSRIEPRPPEPHRGPETRTRAGSRSRPDSPGRGSQRRPRGGREASDAPSSRAIVASRASP